jgi:hypothetical protein
MGDPWTAGEALRRALCVPPGVDVGDGAAAFHDREVPSRRSRSVILFDSRYAAGGELPGPRFASSATAQLFPDRSLEILGVAVWERRF